MVERLWIMYIIIYLIVGEAHTNAVVIGVVERSSLASGLSWKVVKRSSLTSSRC